MVSPEDVTACYRGLLLRDPENEAAIEHHRSLGDLEAVIAHIANSQEFKNKIRPNPLLNYTSIYDPVEIIVRYENRNRLPVPGHRVNFLGVAINVQRFFPDLSLENNLEPIPIPANWHTDLAELSAALRAVDHAGAQFTVVELGCGWGCWLNNAGAAARLLGKRPFLIGIEGDEGHVAFAHEALKTNHFSPTEYRIVRGIAAGRQGSAFFPRQQKSGVSWGLEAVFNPTANQINAFRESGAYDEVTMITLSEIIRDLRRVDLLHIDIQGGETALISESIETINQKVAYIVVGTHSRVIDGEIIAVLMANGWQLEIERPCIYKIDGVRLNTTIDGVQGWRNLRI